MKYLPFENMILESKLDAEEIMSRIILNTEKPNSLKIKDVFKTKDRKCFVGRIKDRTFEISRITANRNAFRPDVQGDVKENENITIVNVKMKLDLTVIAFMGIVIGCALLAFLVFLLVSINSGNLDLIVFIPLGLLVFIYVIVMLGFKTESVASIKYLEKLFEVQKTKKES